MGIPGSVLSSCWISNSSWIFILLLYKKIDQPLFWQTDWQTQSWTGLENVKPQFWDQPYWSGTGQQRLKGLGKEINQNFYWSTMQVWTKPQSPEIKLQQDTGIVLSGKSSCAGVESPHGWFDYCNHNCHNQIATSSLGNKYAFDTAGMNLLNKISFSAHAESKFGTNALTHTQENH